MGKLTLILGLFITIELVSSSFLTNTLTVKEQYRLALKLQQQPADLASAFYSVSGLKALNKEVNDVDSFCQVATKNVKQDDAESVYQFSEVVKHLKCKNIPNLSLNGLINDDTDSISFGRVITAMVNLGNQIDVTTIKKFVDVAKDVDTPVSAAAAFYAVSLLPKSQEVKTIVSMVEDIVAQADEIGGESLQFEGGLSVTSDVIKGIVALSDQQGSPLMKDEQVLKFANYFVNRKYVSTLKEIHHLLSALSALVTGKHQTPVVVSVFKSSLITKDNPVLKVRVTNLLDQTIPETDVTAKSFTTADESVTLFDNKALTKTGEKDDFIVIDGDVARGYIAAHSFSLDVMAARPSRGMYKCNVQVGVKNKKKFLLGGTFSLGVKVLARIMVEDVEVGVGDKDQAVLSKTTKLAYPDKLSKLLDADFHQKVVMTFNLKDLNDGSLVNVHQTFVRLTNEETQQEIFFVAEPDSNNHYKFTLDVSSTGKDSFNNLSGKYKMALVIGDATMQVPISWTLGDITLTFSGKATASKRQQRLAKPKPVIEHMFRIPEKRPAKVVSTAFTALVLSPLLVMFAMWAKIGANLSNFHFSLPTLLFHVGLVGIFVLYYMFWTQYNMFHTLKLLVVIGGVTFLGGNKMLADMAAAKYKA